MKYQTILLFGAPGSGKGTQGKNLGRLPGYLHFACGDAFRSLDPASELGRAFAQHSSGGGLVPDELTVRLWRQSIDALIASAKFDPDWDTLLLDGIPRTVKQARLLDDSIVVNGVIYLVCNNVEEIVARLRKRAESSGRADDTDEEVIRHRMDVYEEVTRPVLELYPRNRIFRVNAVRPVEAVTADLVKVLEGLKR
jgi:adenylate kinase